MPALLCLGCGEDLSSRVADRRALQGPQAEGVVDAWKIVFENVQQELDEDDVLCADILLAGGEVPGKMCRRCFCGFERLSKLQRTLHKNVARGIESQLSQEAQQEQRKRPRVEKKVPSYSTEISRDSPSVSVWITFTVFCLVIFVHCRLPLPLLLFDRYALDIRGQGHLS